MGEEFNVFVHNDTFDLVDRAEANNILSSKWVYRIKCLPSGCVYRNKSRLVVKGFHQHPGVEYQDTFSPLIKHSTIRLVLGTAVAQ